MNEQLKIIISAQTAQAEKNLKAVKEQVSDLGEKGEASSGKFKAAMSKMGSAVATGLKATAGAMAAVGGAVVALTGAAVKNYAEYEQLVGGVETLFGTAADKVKGYADEAYKTAGLSANAYMETITSFSASLLQSFGGDTAAAAEAGNQAVIDMADNANKMGTSMESIQNAYQGFAKQNYTMLDNLKLGYGGTKEEMQRLLEDAEKISGIKYDMSNLGDVYSAIHVIQTELGITGTTAKEAGSTIQGSAAAMKSAWTNLLTGMADENADIDKLITNFIDSIGAFAENLIPRIEIVLGSVVDLIEKLAPKLAAAIPKLVSTLLPKILNAVVNIIKSIAATLPDLIQAVVDVIPQLISAIVEASKAITESLPKIIQTIVDALPTLIPALINGIISLIVMLCENLMSIIMPIVEAIPDIIISIIEALMANLPALIAGIITLVMGIVEAIPDIIQGIVDAIPTIISLLIQAILNNLPAIIGGLIKVVWGIVKSLPQILGSLIEGVVNILAGIWDGLSKVFANLGNWFRNKFGEAFTGIKEAFASVGDFFVGIWDKIKGVFSKVKTWFKDIFKGAWEAIKSVFSGVGSFFGGIWDTIKEKFSGIANKIGEAVSGAFKKAVNWVLEKAIGIINGFIKAINGCISIINKIPAVNIGKLKELEVPKLARGGIVDSETLAVIGERGKEAVVPLENNLGWLEKLAGMLGDRIDGSNKQPIVLMVDKKVLAEASAEGINDITKQSGYFPLVFA